MVARDSADGAVNARRVTVAVAAAGICSFSLLYAPQPFCRSSRLSSASTPVPLRWPCRWGRAVRRGGGAHRRALEIVGKRPVVIVSVLASALLGLVLPFAPSYEVLLVLRVLQGIAIAGFPGVAAAYLTEVLGRAGVAGAVGAMIAGRHRGRHARAPRRRRGHRTGFGWHGALAVSDGSRAVARRPPPSPPPASPTGSRRGRRRSGKPPNALGSKLRACCPASGSVCADPCCGRSTAWRCWRWGPSWRCTTRRASGSPETPSTSVPPSPRSCSSATRWDRCRRPPRAGWWHGTAGCAACSCRWR